MGGLFFNAFLIVWLVRWVVVRVAGVHILPYKHPLDPPLLPSLLLSFSLPSSQFFFFANSGSKIFPSTTITPSHCSAATCHHSATTESSLLKICAGRYRLLKVVNILRIRSFFTQVKLVDRDYRRKVLHGFVRPYICLKR